MKQIMKMITQLALVVFMIVILQQFNAYAYDNEPEGFRGIKWGTNIKDVKNMKLVEDAVDSKFYMRKDEKNKIGDAIVDSIVYVFYNNKFYGVIIKFNSITNFTRLKETFFQQYGSGNKHNRFMEDYDWGLMGSDVYINLKYSEVSEKGQIHYSYRPIAEEKKSALKRKAKEAKDDL